MGAWVLKRAISVLIVFSVLLGVLPCIALAADSALRFIDSMFDAEKGLFYTGTTDDGRTQSRDNIALDAQVWAALALSEQFEPYKPAIAYTVDNLRTAQGGYAFHEDNDGGGYWLEGTAITALALRRLGMEQEALDALSAVSDEQLSSGGLPAATVAGLPPA